MDRHFPYFGYLSSIAKDIEEYKMIKSIPGIEEKIAATIIYEIGVPRVSFC